MKRTFKHLCFHLALSVGLAAKMPRVLKRDVVELIRW